MMKNGDEKNGDEKLAQGTDTTALSAPPYPPARRVRLARIRDIRREAGQIYVEMRRGNLDLSAGCRLVYVLQTIARLVEVETLEARLTKLEANANEQF